MITINAALDPRPAARPRVNTYTRQAFIPASTRDYMKALSMIAKAQMQGKPPLTGKLKIRVELYRNKKPDCKGFGDGDNHLKAVFDALNGIVWEDDSQIVEGTFQKFKSKEPHLIVEVIECDSVTV